MYTTVLARSRIGRCNIDDGCPWVCIESRAVEMPTYILFCITARACVNVDATTIGHAVTGTDSAGPVDAGETPCQCLRCCNVVAYSSNDRHRACDLNVSSVIRILAEVRHVRHICTNR